LKRGGEEGGSGGDSSKKKSTAADISSGSTTPSIVVNGGQGKQQPPKKAPNLGSFLDDDIDIDAYLVTPTEKSTIATGSGTSLTSYYVPLSFSFLH